MSWWVMYTLITFIEGLLDEQQLAEQLHDGRQDEPPEEPHGAQPEGPLDARPEELRPEEQLEELQRGELQLKGLHSALDRQLLLDHLLPLSAQAL